MIGGPKYLWEEKHYSTMTEWTISDGAIIERPRAISDYPLLDEIYAHHDELIGSHIDEESRTLELAFGTHSHPDADVGIDAFETNTHTATGIKCATADARRLPFQEDAFATVIGRRFLHHVREPEQIIEETKRILDPSGTLILLEGTPGRYRQVTKRLAYRLGLLETDTDEYGHLTHQELYHVVNEHGFDITETRALGSPLMPLSIIRSPAVEQLADLYERTQWIRWWTFVVAEPEA